MAYKKGYNPFKNADDVLLAKKREGIIKIKSRQERDKHVEIRTIYPMTKENFKSFIDFVDKDKDLNIDIGYKKKRK